MSTIEYQPPKTAHRPWLIRLFSSRRARRTLGGVAAVVLVLGIFWGEFSYSSVCGTCGCTQDSIDWQVPFTRYTYWHWDSAAQPTSMSTALIQSGLVTPHAHSWMFIAGGGNGASCAIGPGRHFFGVFNSPAAATVANIINLYFGQPKARQFLDGIMDPNQPHSGATSIWLDEVPAKGFSNKQEFDAWWSEHQDFLPMSLD